MTRLAAALALATVTAALCAAAVTGYAIGHHADTAAPDVTVMPCSAWDNGAHPTIPAYTLTNACVDEHGTLHTAPTSTNLTR